MAFLIEHYAGVFPLWLAPTQILFAPVALRHTAFAKSLAQEFRSQNIRAEVDDADETVGNKIRKAAKEKIPYVVVVGDKEVAGEEWMVRVRQPRGEALRGGKEEQEQMSKYACMERLAQEIRERKK